MADLLTIIDYLISNADRISSAVIVVAVVLSLLIGLAEYKGKLIEYVSNRRNKYWFILLLLSLAIIVYFQKKGCIGGLWLVAIAICWLVYGISCVLALRPKFFSKYNNWVLRRYEKWLSAGLSIQHIGFFRKEKHLLFFDVDDKVEYHMLACQYFADIKEYDIALKHLDEIKEKWLYNEEKDYIAIQRALVLMQLGSMKAAFQLLGNPEENKSKAPMAWFVYSYIYENQGNIDKALEYAEKSRDIVDAGFKVSDIVAAEVYNNYSRVAIIKGNRQEALHYLDIAWTIVKRTHDMRTIHIVARNRICQMAMVGKSRPECEQALKEYRDIIPNDSFMNVIEYNNCEVFIHRHFMDYNNEYALLKTGYCEVVKSLNHKQRLIYTASTFQMIMNGHYEHGWFDEYIESDIDSYRELSVMEKLTIFREYMGLFRQDELRSVCAIAPYKALKETILEYYNSKAISDIDELLETIESTSIQEYKAVILQKLWVLKIIEGKKHIDKSKDLYVELSRYLFDAGLHLDAVSVLVSLIDECSSPENTLIWHATWPFPMYYCDYLDSIPPVLNPPLCEDAIHLAYMRTAIPSPLAIKPLKTDIASKYIGIVISEFRSWRNHPYKVDLSVEIARVLMYLNRRNEAKEFYDYFISSGAVESQMPSWMRDDIAALKNEFSNDC